MAEEQKPLPGDLAQQALADPAIGEREGELARTVLYLLTEHRERVAHAEVEVERMRKRLHDAAIAYAAADDNETTELAAQWLEISASVYTRAEQEHAEALEDAGFGHCETCDALTRLEELHLYYEDTGPICPACLSEAEQEQEVVAAARAARKRRRKLS